MPFSDGVVYAIGILFSSTPFLLGFCEGVRQEGYRKFCTIVYLGKLSSTGSIRSICVYSVFLLRVRVMQNGCLNYSFFRCRKVVWCSSVQSNFACCLVRRVRGLAIFANPLINFL